MAVTLFACLVLGLADVASDVEPAAWESAIMTPAVHASVRRSAQSLRSPFPDSEATLIAGGKLYMDDCVGCHGSPGKPSRFGLTFFPPAPQLWQTSTRYSNGEAFWIAKHGIRLTGMSPQGGYSDPDLWRLGMFINRIGNLSPAVLKAVQPAPSSN
jgi:mono/diheme cytochrome c family protein